MHDWRDPALARSWDAEHVARLPTRAEQTEILLALLAGAYEPGTRLLDVGCGPGLVAEAVLERIPEARLTCLDFSEPMLEQARERLRRFGDRVSLVVQDLEHADEERAPDGTFSAAFAVQTLHNLSPEGQQAAVRWLGRVLGGGALFVDVDRVLVPERLYREYQALWRLRVFPFDDAPSYAEHGETLAEQGDRPVALEQLLEWLRESGFDAAVLAAYANRAVVAARKQA